MEKNYNLLDASKILGVKVRTLRNWIIQGKVKGYKYEFSTRWMIPESELRRIMGR